MMSYKSQRDLLEACQVWTDTSVTDCITVIHRFRSSRSVHLRIRVVRYHVMMAIIHPGYPHWHCRGYHDAI